MVVETVVCVISINFDRKYIDPVPKKGSTKLTAVASSYLNGFSKFFYCWKES